jgi:hypothetical protein
VNRIKYKDNLHILLTKILLLVLLGLQVVSCENLTPKKKKFNLPDLPTFSFFYGAFIFPIEKGKEGCRKPNSILLSSQPSFPESIPFCIDSKVNTGLIYDSITKLAITTDTLIAGQSFQCLCNINETTHSIWKKAVNVENFPGNNPAVTTILDSDSGNSILEYRTHYRLPENLYCIALYCKVANSDSTISYKTQYQFLKIR